MNKRLDRVERRSPEALPSPLAGTRKGMRRGCALGFGVTEVVRLREAVAELVSDGDSVALEGFTHLIPRCGTSRRPR